MVLNLGETGGSFRYLSGALVVIEVLGSCVSYLEMFNEKNCLLRKLSDEKFYRK